MTAVGGLVEDTGNLYRYSLRSLEGGFKELPGIEATIHALISIAIDLQKQLSDLIIFRIESTLPIGEEKEETGTERDVASTIQYINNYTINFDPVNIYSLSEVIRDTFEPFDIQASKIAGVFSPGSFLMNPSGIEPEITEKLTTISKRPALGEASQKKVSVENNIQPQTSGGKNYTHNRPVFSENENLYTDLKKSALAINKFKNICDNFVNITIERDSIISEKDLVSNKSSNLLEGIKKETGDIKRNEILDTKGFSNKIYHFSEIIRDSTNSLYTKLSELQEITDILSLDKSLLRRSEPMGSIEDAIDIYSSQDTFKNSQLISDFSKTVNTTSRAIQQNILESQAITDASSLNSSIRTLQNASDFSRVAKTIPSRNKSILEPQAASGAQVTADTLSLNTTLTKTLQEVSGFSEVVRTISTLNKSILESQAIADASQLNNIPIKTMQEISDFPKIVETIPTVPSKNILETQAIIGISSPGRISTKAPQSTELKTDGKKPIIYPDQMIFEIPILRPRMPSGDTAVNVARLSSAISQASHEREKISASREPSLPQAGVHAASPQPIPEPSIYISNAFETISDYITIASEIDRNMNQMTGKGITDTNKISWQNPLLNLMLSEGGSTALNLDRFTMDGDSRVAVGVQMMNIASDMASTEALEREGSSAMNNTSLILSRDYRISSPSMMPYAVENVLHILSGSQRDTVTGSHSGNNTANLQNTFNIVINVKNGGKETELRELGRKIGQIFSDEIRRYGGIR